MRGRALTYKEKLDRYTAKKIAQADKRIVRSAKVKATRERNEYRIRAIKLVKALAKREYGIHLGEYKGPKFMAFLRDPDCLRISLCE
jgi:hypothetical protein